MIQRIAVASSWCMVNSPPGTTSLGITILPHGAWVLRILYRWYYRSVHSLLDCLLLKLNYSSWPVNRFTCCTQFVLLQWKINVHPFISVWMDRCMHACIHWSAYLSVHARTYASIHTPPHTHTHMHAHTHTRALARARAHTHTHTHTHTGDMW